MLVGDFIQTVLHSALIGLVAGCSLGFVTGVLIDRSPFLQRGLLPLAALASTVPLVGIAPIMVMWFGFDWHSQGRRRRRDDLLPDARQHARRPGTSRATCSAT